RGRPERGDQPRVPRPTLRRGTAAGLRLRVRAVDAAPHRSGPVRRTPAGGAVNSPTTIRGRKMTKTMKRRGTIGAVSGALLVGALAMSPAQAEGPSFEVTSSKPTVGIGDQVTITVAAEN